MEGGSSLLRYVEHVKSVAPEYIDLATAQTDAEFAAAFDAILEKKLIELESNRKYFHNMPEDALTSILLIGLSRPGLTVIREGYSNGHVDLTIESEHSSPTKRILVEAKIHDGPQYHIDGMQQLLKRYMSGRETYGVIISYFKSKSIKTLTENIIEKLDNLLPFDQCGKCETHPKKYKWMFISMHQHSSDEIITINHAGCNLFYVDPNEKQDNDDGCIAGAN